jgi:hypothetical protein
MPTRSSGKSPPLAQSRILGIGGGVMVILLAPRLIRMLYPELWVEDDFYLESAYLMRDGMRPYLDFVHPHMPVLEFAIAGWMRVFGASHRSIEVLNQGAIYLTSLLLMRFAQRIAGRGSALCAAILYAFGALVFRYHVFEREIFVGVLILGAALIAIDERPPAALRTAAMALLMIAACAVKLTAGISCVVLIAYIAMGRQRWRHALAAGLGLAAGLCVLTALFYRLYGFEFIFQTYLFHLMKGRDLAMRLALYPRDILDLMIPLFVIGCVRIAADWRGGRWPQHGIALTLVLVAANYIFFGLMSPTAWAHNYLDFLPYVAIIAGLGLERIMAAARELISGERGWSDLGWVAGGMGATMLAFVTVVPLVNENWVRDSIYGFGFVPREEIRQLADAVDAATAHDEPVIAPAFICFEANRRALVRYPETYGVYREAREAYRREGLAAARRELGQSDFFKLIATTSHYWNDEMKDAIRTGRVNVVVPDSRLQLLPVARPAVAGALSDKVLLEQGFRPELLTDHFIMWRRAAKQPAAH